MAISNATAIPIHLSNDITGGYPLHAPEIPNAEPANCMESIVAWLRNDETSLILKAGAVFTVIIALPVLDLGQRTGSTGYLDFLRPNDLTHSVMRGADAGGRPFISLKLNIPSNPGHPPHQTAITFFQRFATGGEWTWGSTNYHGDPVRFGDRLTPQDLAIIRQIVIDRNHPQLTLV